MAEAAAAAKATKEALEPSAEKARPLTGSLAGLKRPTTGSVGGFLPKALGGGGLGGTKPEGKSPLFGKTGGSWGGGLSGGKSPLSGASPFGKKGLGGLSGGKKPLAGLGGLRSRSPLTPAPGSDKPKDDDES